MRWIRPPGNFTIREATRRRCNTVWQMAKSTAKVRSTSAVVATKPGCAPLREMYGSAVAAEPRSWNELESGFVAAMGAFDRNVASGLADMGDLQNGKGDFFNDLLALLLENCAEVQLYSRGGVPGLIFPNHNLDITYPNTGLVGFTLEAKAVGTPRHPGSPRQMPIGRPGSADLAKRVKEVAFKTIDLKAEYGRLMAMRGESPASTPGGNLTTWLRTARPKAYLFIAARVVSNTDFEATVKFARTAGQVEDGVGLFCFGPRANGDPTEYKPIDVPTELSMERVLYRACQDLVGLKQESPVAAPPEAQGLASAADEAAEEATEDADPG